MNIGTLNKRIILQQSTRVSDGMGGFSLTWVDVATVFASMWPLSAAETVEAMKTTMTISHRIRIRYRGDLRSSWRVKFGNRYFSIVSIINPNEKNQMLELMCKEGA
jgi:SPP1 family predicted phage head-tail adaptor